MENQTKTVTKKTELVFTTIEIVKYGTSKEHYVAKFNFGKSKTSLEEKYIYGWNLEDCIQRVSKFLDCEIDERHYILKT